MADCNSLLCHPQVTTQNWPAKQKIVTKLCFAPFWGGTCALLLDLHNSFSESDVKTMHTACTNNQRYRRFQFILPRIPSLSCSDICSIWSGLVVNPERRDMLSLILCCGTLCGQRRRETWGGGGKGRGRTGLRWVPGRFRVRNEAVFWTVPLRSQWVGQIRQTAANPPTTSLSPRSSIRPQTASVSSTMCLSPLCLSLLNIYNKWVTDMVLTETRLTTLTRLTSLFSLRCTR